MSETMAYTWLDALTTIIPSHPSGESLLLSDVFGTGNRIPYIITEQQTTGQTTQICGWTSIRRLAPIAIIDLKQSPVNGAIHIRGIDGLSVKRAFSLDKAHPIRQLTVRHTIAIKATRQTTFAHLASVDCPHNKKDHYGQYQLRNPQRFWHLPKSELPKVSSQAFIVCSEWHAQSNSNINILQQAFTSEVLKWPAAHTSA